MSYVSGVPGVTGSQVVGGVLTPNQGNVVDDTGILNVEYSWWRGSTLIQNWESAPATISSVDADIAKGFYCRMRYSDGVSTQPVIESRSVLIGSGDQLSHPAFKRKNQLPITNTLTSGRVWSWADQGDYIYAAANADGIYPFDISDPINPIQQQTVKFKLPNGDDTDIGITDIKILGNFLLVCGRKISWDEINGDAGIFAVYSLTNPAQPQWLGSYQPSSMDPRPLADMNGAGSTARYGDVWYQGMTTDPSDLGVIMLASQFDGLTILDASGVVGSGSAGIVEIGKYGKSELDIEYAITAGDTTSGGTNVLNDTSGVDFTDPLLDIKIGDKITNIDEGFFASITGIAPTALACTNDGGGAGTTATFLSGNSYRINTENFMWETSRIDFYIDPINGADMVSMANHGNGTMLANVDDKSDPVIVVSTEAPAYEPLDGDATTPNAVQLRGRYVIVEDGIQYSCNNIGGNANRPERGLLTLDVGDYSARTAGLTVGEKRDLYNWAPIGFGYNDIWNDAGDQPILGLFKTPGDPYVYLANGQEGTAIFYVGNPLQPVFVGMTGTNMEDGTNLYMSYQFTRSGKTYMWYADAYDAAPQLHNLYIDEATGMAINEYIIGYPIDGGLGTVDVSIQATNTINYSTSKQRAFSAIPIPEDVEIYEAYFHGISASGNARITVYNSEFSGAAGQNWPVGAALLDASIPVNSAIAGTFTLDMSEIVSQQSGALMAIIRADTSNITIGKNNDTISPSSSRDSASPVDADGWPIEWTENQVVGADFIYGFRARSLPSSGGGARAKKFRASVQGDNVAPNLKTKGTRAGKGGGGKHRSPHI